MSSRLKSALAASVSLALLTTLGVAALTWYAGLSMALGALLAGLIIYTICFPRQLRSEHQVKG